MPNNFNKNMFLKNILRLFAFLIMTFLALYIFLTWVSVFYYFPFGNVSNNLQYINFGLGFHQVDTDAVLYLSLAFLLIFSIPFIRGIVNYWRGQEKNQMIKKNLILLSLLFWPIALLSLLSLGYYLFSFLALFLLIAYSIIFVFLFGLYIFLFWIIDKKILIYVSFIALVALLIMSLIFPFKFYIMASDCENFTDTYCAGMKASWEKDFSICEKVNPPSKSQKEYEKNNCVKIYGEKTGDPSGCLKLSTVPLINSLSESDKEYLADNWVFKLSPQVLCIEDLMDYYKNRATSNAGTCDLLTNLSERNHCKKNLECTRIRGEGSEMSDELSKKYDRCNNELEQILNIK